MTDLNYDVTAQAFKLTSKTYADNNTGTFVSRMVSEPENVVNKMVSLVDCITSTLTSIAIIIYVIF